MPVTIETNGSTMTARLSGELDHHRARGLMEGIDREIDMRLPSRVALDLGGVTFMDSSGIAVLLRAWRRMSQVQGAMRVVNVPPQADKVFRAAGLQRIIRFEPGERQGAQPAPRG